MTVRAQFDGKALIPVNAGQVQLEPGQIYDLEIRETGINAGSPKGILAILDSLPKIAPQDVDAMEREIAQASQPARFKPVFDEPGAG
jgi:hypothetical protein